MPEESAQVPAPENKTSVLDKNVPNPLAKNPNIHTHKVFASVGLILIGVIVILGLLAFMYRDQVQDIYDYLVGSSTTTESTKVSTSSATNKSGATVYKTNIYSFNYLDSWKIETDSASGGVNLSSPDAKWETYPESIEISGGTLIRFLPKTSFDATKTLEQYVKDVSPEVASGEGKITKITVDGEEAVRLDTKMGATGTARGDYVATSVYILKVSDLYEIARLYPEGKMSEYEAEFKDVLTSLKFM